MERRDFLLALAAGTAAVLSGCTGGLHAASGTARRGTATASAVPLPVPTGTPAGINAQALAGVPHVGGAQPRKDPGVVPPSVIDHLPEQAGTSRFALTIDDGVSTPVLEAYVDFIRLTGIRVTFFVNGVYESWRDVRDKLAPLVDSAQVQLGNHTWNHPDVLTLSDREIEDQLRRNDTFLTNTFGVSGRPYFRPPYGHHDARTDRVTAGLGYLHTVMWLGSLGDSAVLSPAQVLANATEWFQPRHVVIGHANHPAVTYVFAQLAELIRERRLQTVTLNDVFSPLG